jgi:flagellar P-ring protein precursor FlgI
VRALSKIKTSPRDMISILQAMKTAGALYADLIIQ